MAFDKTGTLTEGKPKVTDVVAFGRSEADVLRLAAALETGSSHPLALRHSRQGGRPSNVAVPPARDAKAIGGKGVTATVDGVEVFLGSPQAADERVPLSADQTARITALNDEGKTVSVLLVGD